MGWFLLRASRAPKMSYRPSMSVFSLAAQKLPKIVHVCSPCLRLKIHILRQNLISILECLVSLALKSVERRISWSNLCSACLFYFKHPSKMTMSVFLWLLKRHGYQSMSGFSALSAQSWPCSNHGRTPCSKSSMLCLDSLAQNLR